MKLDTHLELRDLVIEHQKSTIEMLWNKVFDVFRYMSDISDLATHGTTTEFILEYFRDVDKEERDYCQSITVQNKEIDLSLL